MTEKEQPDNNSSPENQIKSSEPFIPPKNINLSNDKQDEEIPDESKQAKQITTIEPTKQKDWQPRIANLIAFFALIVSGILAIYTYKVFKIADAQSGAVIKSADAAKEAARVADSSLAETKRYNKKYLFMQSSALKSSNNESDRREQREIKNLQEQRNVLKETKQEFEIENRPELQTIDCKIDTMLESKQIYVSYKYYNFGKLATKLISSKVAVVFSHKLEYPSRDTVIQYSKANVNTFLATGVSETFACNSSYTITKKFIDLYNKGSIFIYLIGYVEYFNSIIAKNYTYKYKIRFRNKPIKGFDIVENSFR